MTSTTWNDELVPIRALPSDFILIWFWIYLRLLSIPRDPNSRFNLQAISSVLQSSTFKYTPHHSKNFLYFLKIFFYSVLNNFNFVQIRHFQPILLFLWLNMRLYWIIWEIPYYYRWSRQRSRPRLIWWSIQQLKLLLLCSIRELEVSVLGVSRGQKLLPFPRNRFIPVI